MPVIFHGFSGGKISKICHDKFFENSLILKAFGCEEVGCRPSVFGVEMGGVPSGC
jgi:hypothetical protein